MTDSLNNSDKGKNPVERVNVVSLKNMIPNSVLNSVEKVIQSGYWINGPHAKKLEENFAEYCGTKFCKSVCNGTAALMAIVGALGLKKGDEVIVPSFTFIATANSVLSVGATPVFVDINPDTFTMDPVDIENKITKNTKAIMPVHLFGCCADMNSILTIAEKNNLVVIEDAAQAHGASIGSKKAGSFGNVAGFSLYPTKNMFCGGEGGLITTSDEVLYNKITKYMNHGQKEKYVHDELGYNFRMPEINAVLAEYSLSKIDEWNLKRAENAIYLNQKISEEGLSEIETPIIPENYVHVFHQYTIKIKDNMRTKVINALMQKNIGYGIHYALPVHKQPYYQKIGYSNVSLPVTEFVADEVLSLPIHPSLTLQELDYIVDTLLNVLKK